MFHRNSTLNHKPENWTYANAAARVAATGFVVGDVGKLAYQTDTGTYWRLNDESPITWQLVANPANTLRYKSSPAIAAGAAANVDASLADTFQERTLTINTTLTLINLTDGQVVVVPVRNTASNYTLAWVGVDEWKGTAGVAPVLSLGAVTDLFTFAKIGSKVFGTYAAGA
jgi:hypothetical protein